MIRRLRTTHRWIWLALAIFLPALLFLAMRARTEMPLQELPPTLAPAALPADDSR